MTTAWGGSVPANILNLVAYTVRVAASEVPYDGYRVVGADGDELLAAVRVFPSGFPVDASLLSRMEGCWFVSSKNNSHTAKGIARWLRVPAGCS